MTFNVFVLNWLVYYNSFENFSKLISTNILSNPFLYALLGSLIFDVIIRHVFKNLG